MATALIEMIDTKELRLKTLREKSQDYLQNCRSSNTLRSIRSDWRSFQAWCREYSFSPLPADANTVVLYLTDLADRLKASTVKRRLASINHMHVSAGFRSFQEDALVRGILVGLKRTLGTTPEGKSALTIGDLKKILVCLPNDIQGKRDRSILLLGFAAGLRRSELVSLDAQDLEWFDEGVVITLNKSKTDQEGEGHRIGISNGTKSETCPVHALKDWLDASKITSGPLFRPIGRCREVLPDRLAGRCISRIVKSAAEMAGLDSSQLSSHSLRSGFCTAAAAAQVPEREIMRVTGHRSLSVLRGYIRQVSLFDGQITSALNL